MSVRWKKIRKSRGVKGRDGQGLRGGDATATLTRALKPARSTRGASASALQAYSSYLVSFSAPGGGSGLYKMSRQELETAAAVHLPGPCQILEITLALCQDASSTEKIRNGRGNLAIWPSNSCVYYITQISPCC